MVRSSGRLFSLFTALLAAPAPAFAAEAAEATGEFYLLALGLAVIGISGLILIRKQSSLL